MGECAWASRAVMETGGKAWMLAASDCPLDCKRAALC